MRQRVIQLMTVGALAFVGGCTEDVGDYEQGYSIGKPAHPAMSGTAEKQPRKSKSSLPAGHPPVAGGASAPGGRPPSAGGASSPGASTGSGDSVAPGSTDGGPMTLMGMTFDVPKGWVREVPANRMRLAQFKLPRVDGDSEDAVVTVIPAAGSVEDNVARWEGQFTESTGRDIADRSGAMETKIVAIEGTFLYKARPMEPGPGTPRPGYKLYAAVVQAPQSQMFFKGVGPKATMEKWQKDFDAMVASFKR